MRRISQPSEAVRVEIRHKLWGKGALREGVKRRTEISDLTTLTNCKQFNVWVRHNSPHGELWRDEHSWWLLKELLIEEKSDPLMIACAHLLALHGPYDATREAPGTSKHLRMLMTKQEQTWIDTRRKDADTVFRMHSNLRAEFVKRLVLQGLGERELGDKIRERPNGSNGWGPSRALAALTNALFDRLIARMSSMSDRDWGEIRRRSALVEQHQRNLDLPDSATAQVLNPADFADSAVELIFSAALTSQQMLIESMSRRRLFQFIHYLKPQSEIRSELELYLWNREGVLPLFTEYVSMITSLRRLEETYGGRELSRALGTAHRAFLNGGSPRIFDQWPTDRFEIAEFQKLDLTSAHDARKDEMLRVDDSVARLTLTTFLWCLNGRARVSFNGPVRELSVSTDEALEVLTRLVSRLQKVFPHDVSSGVELARLVDRSLFNRLFAVTPLVWMSRFDVDEYRRAEESALRDGLNLWPVEPPRWSKHVKYRSAGNEGGGDS